MVAAGKSTHKMHLAAAAAAAVFLLSVATPSAAFNRFFVDDSSATAARIFEPAKIGAVAAGDDNLCVYTVYVKTGAIVKGGTDSKIGLEIAGSDGRGVRISDLELVGLMGADHDYFERGNLDAFSGRGPCLSSSSPCWMNLTSDGSGRHHGWYCDYVEVTTTGPHRGCSQVGFAVDQWLARDVYPFSLYAERNYCNGAALDVASGGGGAAGGAAGESELMLGEIEAMLHR